MTKGKIDRTIWYQLFSKHNLDISSPEAIIKDISKRLNANVFFENSWFVFGRYMRKITHKEIVDENIPDEDALIVSRVHGEGKGKYILNWGIYFIKIGTKVVMTSFNEEMNYYHMFQQTYKGNLKKYPNCYKEEYKLFQKIGSDKIMVVGGASDIDDDPTWEEFYNKYSVTKHNFVLDL